MQIIDQIKNKINAYSMHLKDFLNFFCFLYIKFQLLSSLQKKKLLSKCQLYVTKKKIENKNKSSSFH